MTNKEKAACLRERVGLPREQARPCHRHRAVPGYPAEFALCGGSVTLLNIGTSGSVYIHVPNPYVLPEQTIVNGRSYL